MMYDKIATIQSVYFCSTTEYALLSSHQLLYMQYMYSTAIIRTTWYWKKYFFYEGEFHKVLTGIS